MFWSRAFLSEARAVLSAMDPRLLDLAARQRSLFARHQVFDLGLTRTALDGYLRRGRCVLVAPRVYRIPGTGDSPEQELLRAVLWGGRSAVASHRSAARLWNLDGAEPTPGAHRTAGGRAGIGGVADAAGGIEITVPYCHDDVLGGVRVHRTRRLDRVDRRLRSGVPVTAPERTLVDLAAVLDEEALEMALESALRLHLTDPARLGRRIERLAGRRGLRVLRRLLRERPDRPAESGLEVRVQRFLRERGIDGFLRQYDVWDGRQWRRLDWANPDTRVALEADGWQWHSDRIAWSRDRTRSDALAALGWRFLHVTAHDLDDPDAADALTERILRSTDPAA